MEVMIKLVDPCKDKSGHNVVYLSELNTIDNTKVISLDIDNGERNNVISFIFSRYKNFKKQLRTAKEARIIHFLHADLYYMGPFFFKFYSAKTSVILTMHYFPSGIVRQILLKNFCRKANRIIVHSSYIKSQYNSIGIKNVNYIDYPSFYDYSKIQTKRELRTKFGIKDDEVVISALGGTRYDKGLDILLDAFSKLTDDIKKRVVLNIAGRPLIFKEKFISEKVGGANIKARLVLKEMTDEEFLTNVVISDYLVLPYRKDFSGNSGPMTEAIVNSVPCIVSNHGNVGYMTTHLKIGRTFESEDANNLALVITEEIINPGIYDFSYSKELTKEKFINKHKEIYKNI